MTQEKDIILYSYFRSSASYRVRIALALKDLKYEYRAIHLLKEGGQQRGSDYAETNPMKHVPALVHGDFRLGESMAILKYLDHLNQRPLLFPSDPKNEARVLQICELINSGIQPLQNLKVLQKLESMGIDKDGQKEWVLNWIYGGFEALNRLLQNTSGQHCFGDDWTAADCLLVPQVFAGQRFGLSLESYPLIEKIYAHLENHPAVKKAHPSHQPDSE